MKSFPKRKSEATLYTPAKEALLKLLSSADCYLEITAERRLGEKIKRVLADYDLFANVVERFIPDITGYFSDQAQHRAIVVGEVKAGSPRLKDIFQTKEYAEIFGAEYAFLISPEEVSEEIKRILTKKPQILSHSAGYLQVRIGLLDADKKMITTWFPDPPKIRSATLL